MSSKLEKRERLLRLRGVQHRIAHQHLMDADRHLAGLKGVEDRLRLLKLQLRCGDGPNNGQNLRAHHEMMMRLDAARWSLRSPIDQAESTVEDKKAERREANLREKGAEKLAVAEQTAIATTIEVKADANKVFRSKKLWMCSS